MAMDPPRSALLAKTTLNPTAAVVSRSPATTRPAATPVPPLRTPSSDGDSPVVSANGVLRRRRVRRRLDLSDHRRRPPSAEREAEYAACEGMAAGRPSWEGRDSPDEEEHTMVEDGQWSPDNLA